MHQTGQVVLVEILVLHILLKLLIKDQVDHKGQDFRLKTLEYFSWVFFCHLSKGFLFFLLYIYLSGLYGLSGRNS